MSSELQEKLKTLKNCSAWEFDEVLVLLTGVTSTQIEYLEPRVHPPVLDIRYVLMLETREITWPAGSETVGGHAIYGKGDVVPVNKKQAKHFISNGWAEDSESSAERKNRIKKEENQYQQARDQSTLMEMLERAILDRDIKSLNDVDTYPREKWRLNKTSVLQWIDINKVTVFQLRHFPNNIDDILDNELQLFKETRPTTDKPVVKPERTTPISPLDAKIQPEPVVNVFRNDGDIWIIIFNEKELPKITDVKGLSYVQHALMNPDEIIPNKQIEGHFDESDSSEIDGSEFAAGSSSEKMDPDTYRAIMEEKDIKSLELERNLKQGKLDNIKLENEIEKIERYLSQNTYQGRIKEFTNEDIRASDRIRAAIKTAIDKINEHDSSLAKLLKSSIKTSPTGTRYTPIPGIAPWER